MFRLAIASSQLLTRRAGCTMQGSAGADAATQAKKRITTVWFFTMGLIFCSIFVAIATAANNDCEKQYCSKSKGFAQRHLAAGMAIKEYFGLFKVIGPNFNPLFANTNQGNSGFRKSS